MENFYLIIVVVLFALAISDLIVGVSNDAVNFLNSAIGSKAAPRWAIMIIASLGIIIGASFSGGMMEVARKGIFHPDQFYFAEIMTIFVAVMITDILLLDFYNTIGLPTSTTVSIVFELLGAAVAVAVVKIVNNPDQTMLDLGQYINSDKALAIIAGILLSVIIAFLSGAIVQYVSRLVFTYNYQEKFKYYGAIFGGIAITSITYFMIIKGTKGSNLIPHDALFWIKNNTLTIIVSCFIAWTIILQLLMSLFKINILRIVVLVGTFSLAMAFAGNDLVNFIGVPLAGFKSFQAFVASPGADPSTFSMGMLSQKLHTEWYLLIIAGLVMTITLWFSKKAKSVTETEIGLSTQNQGDDKFGSSYFSRLLVRRFVNANNNFKRILPEKLVENLSIRFSEPQRKKEDNPPAFDMLRASVNLTVASILISIGTSLKLPLSTTYVTFMVAMGTSLSDRAWGRDSAVFRVTGVLTVIGGWFFTAFMAFTAAFVFANLINWFGGYAITGLLIFALALLIKSHLAHKKKINAKNNINKDDESIIIQANQQEQSLYAVAKLLQKVPSIYQNLITGLATEDRKKLKLINAKVYKLDKEAKQIKNQVPKVLEQLNLDNIYTGPYYVQLIDYLREMAHALTFIAQPAYTYVDNNHKIIIQEQIEELNQIHHYINEYYSFITKLISENNFSKHTIEQMLDRQNNVITILHKSRKEQIKRIKNGRVGTKNSVLFLGIINETKNLILNTGNLIKASRDFIGVNNGNILPEE